MSLFLFTISDINFSKTVFFEPIYQLLSAQISIGIAKKQALMTHFGDANFDVMRSIIPFRSHSTAPFGLPKMNRSCCSNIYLPLGRPLPSHHNITISHNTPFLLDAGALQNALDTLIFVYSSWLTNNPLLDLWMQAACQYPDTFS